MLLGTEGVEFQNSIVHTLDKDVKSIAVDLSSIEYVMSWGIGMLFYAFQPVQTVRLITV